MESKNSPKVIYVEEGTEILIKVKSRSTDSPHEIIKKGVEMYGKKGERD